MICDITINYCLVLDGQLRFHLHLLFQLLFQTFFATSDEIKLNCRIRDGLRHSVVLII